MKTVSDDLRAILGGSQFAMADCYSFTLRDGTVVRYTSADADIVDQATGNRFLSGGPYFERSKVKFQTGVAVDELDITASAKVTDLLDGAPFLSALRAGVLDGALVQLDRAFMATFGDTSAGLITLFLGRVAEIEVGRTVATIKANTPLELFEPAMAVAPVPGRLFTHLVRHRLHANQGEFRTELYGGRWLDAAGSANRL